MTQALVLGLLTRLGLAVHETVDPAAFARALESWHEFYILAGTAAVTLAGLLFVSMSLNMEHLLHDSRAHLMRFARNTMLVYVVVLLMSLMMLVPDLPAPILAAQVGTLGVLLGALSLLAMVRLVREPDPLFTRRHRLRRALSPVLASALMVSAASGLARAERDAFYELIASVCVLLASAVWSSWDLLVGVARARRGELTGA